MEAVKIVEKGIEFFDSYKDKIDTIIHSGIVGEPKEIIIDFADIVKFNTELADDLLDTPDEVIRGLTHSLGSISDEAKALSIRFKNVSAVSPSNKIPIHMLRSIHLEKFITVEGMIKQKSDVRPQAISAKFECPSCGLEITIIQTDLKFKEPKSCQCGRKGHFRVVNKEQMDVMSMQIEEPTELMTGGSKLSKILVLCRKSLCRHEVERRFSQGIRIEVSGILKEVPIFGKDGGKLTRIDWYIDANYINVLDESFVNI
jgi:replicative DNA helicase Mcm